MRGKLHRDAVILVLDHLFSHYNTLLIIPLTVVYSSFHGAATT